MELITDYLFNVLFFQTKPKVTGIKKQPLSNSQKYTKESNVPFVHVYSGTIHMCPYLILSGLM